MSRYIAPMCIMLSIIIGLAIGCNTEKPPPVEYSLSELKYIVLGSFDDVFWCDPDFYPVVQPEQEEKNALEQFPTISAIEAEFSAILQHLGLPNKTGYTDEEKLLIYREHKKLTYQVEMTPSGTIYQFSLRVEEGEGERIEGTITLSGDIEVTNREPSFNTCPICLASGTLIDAPGGPIPVERLCEGAVVWTIDECGNRTRGTVLKTAMTPVPSSFHLVKVILSDGRNVTASWSHPTAEGRALGNYGVGDVLDGAIVMAMEYEDYDGVTCDLLPSGGTGFYWADGILLKSTIATTLTSTTRRP